LVNCLQSWNDQQILQTYEELTAGRTINLADAPVAAVIGCDFSGIQSFIYSVTSELALKGLRGRSMYLQLLSETLVKALLKTFRGTTANVIMNAGGNALLLMPYSSAFAAQMQTVKQSIEAAFLPAHRGKLTFSLAYEVVTTADLFGHRFADVHARVKRKLAVEKRKKFSSLLSRPQSAKDVFGPFDSGGDRKLCQVCSAELSPQEQREAEAEDIHQCRMCKSFVQLAYDITHAQAIVYRTAPGLFASLPGQITGYEQILEAIGAHLDLHAKAAGYRLNDTAFLTGEKHMSGFRFLPNHAPMLSERNPKKLEDLAECAQGVKAWGVVRMDVDHLGAIVGKSMVEGHTIETLSALSEMINLFFTAHVYTIAKNEFGQDVYLIYSGGDDLFALGAWSSLTRFAQRIYEDFRQYTGFHPDLTISAGIFLAPSKKFPVYQAADLAGDALTLAKNEGRNKITLFDRAVQWGDLADLSKITDEIVILLNGESPGAMGKKAPRSLLQVLASGWTEKVRHDQDVKRHKPSIFRIWRILYAFKRLKERHGKLDRQIDHLEKLILNKTQIHDNLDICVRWAEYKTRRQKTEREVS